jgi:hypothetical protein
MTHASSHHSYYEASQFSTILRASWQYRSRGWPITRSNQSNKDHTCTDTPHERDKSSIWERQCVGRAATRQGSFNNIYYTFTHHYDNDAIVQHCVSWPWCGCYLLDRSEKIPSEETEGVSYISLLKRHAMVTWYLYERCGRLGARDKGRRKQQIRRKNQKFIQWTRSTWWQRKTQSNSLSHLRTVTFLSFMQRTSWSVAPQ